MAALRRHPCANDIVGASVTCMERDASPATTASSYRCPPPPAQRPNGPTAQRPNGPTAQTRATTPAPVAGYLPRFQMEAASGKRRAGLELAKASRLGHLKS